MSPLLSMTREELSRALRIAALSDDRDLADDAAFRLRRMDKAPTMPRLGRVKAARVTLAKPLAKPRRLP